MATATLPTVDEYAKAAAALRGAQEALERVTIDVAGCGSASAAEVGALFLFAESVRVDVASMAADLDRLRDSLAEIAASEARA